ALLRMPMQLTPEVQTPTITVETRWPGASPQEVEQEIVVEQEEQLKGVEGVTKMSSESSDSIGRITLEFLVGTRMQQAVVDVIGRLEQVPEYPEDADKPVITTANANNSPIAWFILSPRYPTSEEFDAFEAKHPALSDKLARVRDSSNEGLGMLRLRLLAKEHPEVAELLPPPDMDVTKLRRFAEDEIEARFERVPGVSQSNVIGGLEDELQVVVDPEKLAARQLTITDVRMALRTQNADTSGGDYWEGKRRWVVRTLGQFRSPEQVEKQLITVRDGNPVYVRDIGTVQLGYKKPDGLVRRFGEASIAVNALRETGANVLDAMEGLQAVNQELNDGVLKQNGLQLTQVYDETEYIYSSIGLVQQNIFIGGALTMIVLMIFLHLGVRVIVAVPLIVISALAAAYLSPWYFALTLAVILVVGMWVARGALVVGLAIPTSIIGTFLIMGLLGRSLNVISLAGLAFAVGMLVDNAVVVLENIFRRWSDGERPFDAAVRGTTEVWGAVLSSTLTTIAVFLPIVFVQEEAGQLFRDIAMAISAAVALSLLISMTLIPMASARLLGKGEDEHDERHSSHASGKRSVGQRKRARPSRAVVWLQWLGSGFTEMVVGSNAWIQRGVLRRLITAGLLVGIAVGLTWLLFPKVEYLPTGNRNLVFGILLPPPGYNLDELMEMGERVEAGLRPYWDVDSAEAEHASLDHPAIADFFFVARGRQVFIGLRAMDPSRVRELVPLVQKVGAPLPGTFAVAKQSSIFEQGLAKGRA
ncbi:MAG: efflux RND transporter permease subunit, partial [Planctomycetales bacterium]|nr:efflux RND transporter permease subunit [Planctomycetales bacterium]